MGDEMHGRAGGGAQRHETRKSQRSESLCNRGAECQQPHGVEEQMAEIGVDERIGDERPDVGCPTSRPGDVGEHAGVVACGDEGK
jgi:hypothetical protein